MAYACAEKGYLATTVADVVRRAGVSRATFYALFRDKEDCFLAAYDAIAAEFIADALAAYRRPGPWPARVRAAIEAMLAFGAERPAHARMALIEGLAAGSGALERYQQLVRMVAAFADEGQEYAARDLPPRIGRAVVGGGLALVRVEIVAGRTERLPALLPDLLYTTLAPYLGHEEAMRETRALREELAS